MLKIYRLNSSSANFIGNKLRLRGWHMSMSNLSNKVFIYESFLPNEDVLQILRYADTLSINKPSFVNNVTETVRTVMWRTETVRTASLTNQLVHLA